MAASCPCCGNHAAATPLEALIERLEPMEARVLAAVWAGRGFPVQTSAIFDLMYSDDIDGGPSQNRMYTDLRSALSNLKSKLSGSGSSIVAAGYRTGYRLILDGA